MTADPDAGAPRSLPAHVTMPLLDVITRNSLDQDYQHVADAKRMAGQGGKPKKPGRRAATVVAVFGVLIVTAAVQTSRNADTAERTREELIDQIQVRSDQVRAQQRQITRLREQNADLERELAQVTRRERAAAARVLTLRGVTGFAPVTGPGVRIRVDDAEDGSDKGVVRDSDLAVLVDGLWAAGAEAISINNQRLTSVAGIRSASGRAIHIKTLPLKPPYVVLAIGDRNTLQSRFAESSPGQLWYSLWRSFHFEFDIDNDSSLTLPAGRRPELRAAGPIEFPSQTKEVAP